MKFVKSINSPEDVQAFDCWCRYMYFCCYLFLIMSLRRVTRATSLSFTVQLFCRDMSPQPRVIKMIINPITFWKWNISDSPEKQEKVFLLLSGLNVICDCSANYCSVGTANEWRLIYMSIERRAETSIPDIMFADSDYRTRIIREPSTIMKGVHINRKHSLMIPRINRMKGMKPAEKTLTSKVQKSKDGNAQLYI